MNYVVMYGTERDLTFDAVFIEDETKICNGETINSVPKTGTGRDFYGKT